MRKKDELWKFTTRNDPSYCGGNFNCKFCGKVFAPGTHISRIKYHLAGVTNKGVDVCAKVPEHVKRQALACAPIANKYLASNGHFGKKASNGHSNIKKLKNGSSSPNSDTTLSEISDANCSNDIDNLLAKFFGMNNIDCSVAESPSFLNLFHALRTKDPGKYVPPSSDTLRRLIPLVRQEFEQSVARARQSLERSGFTIVPHVWWKSYLSIIACSRESALLLDTYVLPKETPHLEEVFRMVVSGAGAEKIVHCVMVDDSPWARSFGEFLTREYPHICVTKCAALCIQSLLEEICTELEWVRHTLCDAEIIFNYACKNNDILTMRKYNNRSKELQQQYRHCHMLGAIFEAKQELVKRVQSPNWFPSGNGNIGITAIKIIKDEEFWNKVEKLHMALKPFLQAFHLDDIGQLGFDDLYWLMEMAGEAMEMADEAIGTLCKDYLDKCHRMGDIFQSRRRQIIDGIHKAATFLNPQIRRAEIVHQRRDVKEDIDYMLKNLVSSDDQRAFENQAHLYCKMLSYSRACYATIAVKDFTPREWWNEFGERFPVLAKYAVKILSQPCSSASLTSSLRAFLANQIEERNGVVPELDYLRSRMNEVFMEKFNTHETSEREKVDLEEFRRRSLMNESSHLSGYNVTEKGSTSRHSTRSGSALPAPQYVSSLSSQEPRHIVNEEPNDWVFIGSTELSVQQYFKLRFRTTISPTILVGQKVEGEQVSQIHVFIEDPSTGGVLQAGLPPMLGLTVSVLDGDYINEEASGDVHWTREQYNSNDLRLTRYEPLVTGDLELMLEQGVGRLGDFSFNYSSLRTTSSGKFRLGVGVKTDTGYCGEIRILEGISSAFVVLDNEDLLRQSQSPLGVPLPDDFAGLGNEMFNIGIPHGQHGLANNNDSVNYTGPNYFQNHGFQSCSKRKHIAAIRVKRKAVLHLYQRLRRKTSLKRKAVPFKAIAQSSSAEEEVQCLEAVEDNFDGVARYCSEPIAQSSSAVEEVQCLEALEDTYGKVMVNLNEPIAPSSSAVEEVQCLDAVDDTYNRVTMNSSEPIAQSSSAVEEVQCLDAVDDTYNRVTMNLSEPIAQFSSAVEEVQCLDVVDDIYNRVTVKLSEPMNAEEYRKRLRASMSKWRDAKKESLWILLPIALSNLVHATVKEGFECRGLREGYIMLVNWHLITPSIIPGNASQRIGIDAFVMNDKNEVLVVQEISGKFKGKDVWRLPTGLINEDEDIRTTAIRKVKEETGIDCEFLKVVTYRRRGKSFVKMPEILFICMMQPLSYEIEKQTQEIKAQWMPIEEYAAQEFVQTNKQFKYIAEFCVAKSKEKLKRGSHNQGSSNAEEP